MARLALALWLLAALLTAPAAGAAGQVKAGAAVVDGTYNVGSSAGQYSSTREEGYGDPDPHVQSVKNQASYGVQSRETVRALVIKGGDGKLVALLSDNHYIPQDALLKRTAQLVSEQTGGAIDASNLTMAVTHNHSSPSHSAISWGVWTFQDVFDFRFYDYYARQNAKAIVKAYRNLHDVRVSATVSNFDAFQRNPMGPGQGDEGTPVGFPRSFTDHDLSVIRFENIDDPARPKGLATLVNIGQHPEFLAGYDLISGEYTEAMQAIVDRKAGGVTIFTQNATGTSEVERDNWHDVNTRAIFDHAQYAQMEWAAHQLGVAVLKNIADIEAQRPNPDRESHFGMTPYHDRFIAWMSDFPVAMENRWFPGPVSHPYPGVSNCRTDATFEGKPSVVLAELPTCGEVPAGASLMPVTGKLPVSSPGISTDTFQQLGIPLPENLSVPSSGALQDTLGAHLQAIRLGDILLTVCSCEQWADQSLNMKTRTDTVAGNEWVGYDPTSPDADQSMKCVQNGDGTYSENGTGTGTWTCSTSPSKKLSDRLVQKMRAQINNDATGWDDPKCLELGCGAQAESEPVDLKKIRGNFTHDDTAANARNGYRMTVTISMANDYNGYIPTYRDYMSHDHYRKSLAAFGSHSMDYLATRLVRMGRALKGDGAALKAIELESDVNRTTPEHAALAAKVAVDQAHEETKVRAVGEAASAAARAYGRTIPDDGGSEQALTQPEDIERFDAATFSWDGGNNYTDTPRVVVQRRKGGRWQLFANQFGEVPMTLRYPGTEAHETFTTRTPGQRWRWTATFEAFVSRFALFTPSGKRYRATPAGEYRFLVRGTWRKGGRDVRYKRVSDPFQVRPWRGITVERKRLDGGHVTFKAGPTTVVDELRVRRTDRPSLRGNGPDGKELPVTFSIGPVDYPDMAKEPVATGARFLTGERGYSAASWDEVEHYCLDCRFRDWLDVAGELTATVTFVGPGRGYRIKETVRSTDGTFRTQRRAKRNERVEIVVEDAWGNSSGAPVGL
jgi:hypothetical protein